jgi:hypothetical protein
MSRLRQETVEIQESSSSTPALKGNRRLFSSLNSTPPGIASLPVRVSGIVDPHPRHTKLFNGTIAQENR